MTSTGTRTRRNGEGSRPRAVPGRDDLWQIRFWTLAGVRQSVYVKGSEEDAWARLRELTSDRDRGVPFAASRHTLGSWLPTWLDAIPPDRLRPRSRDRYRALTAHWSGDPIGRRKLHELLPEHIGGALGRMHREGLSPATQQQAMSILRMALEAALQSGHVGVNMARRVRSPKGTPRAIEPPKGADLEQLRAMIATDRLEALWACGLMAGLREGEALGLRWRDVDLGAGIIHVRGTLQYGTDHVGPPKSKRSLRDLPIDPALAAILARHRDRTVGVGVRPHPATIVFHTRTGRALHARNVLEWWHELCDRAGTRRYRYHDLRHAFATIALEAGTPIAVLSRYLGHSSIQITVDTYGHQELVGLPWQLPAAATGL